MFLKNVADSNVYSPRLGPKEGLPGATLHLTITTCGNDGLWFPAKQKTCFQDFCGLYQMTGRLRCLRHKEALFRLSVILWFKEVIV